MFFGSALFCSIHGAVKYVSMQVWNTNAVHSHSFWHFFPEKMTDKCLNSLWENWDLASSSKGLLPTAPTPAAAVACFPNTITTTLHRHSLTAHLPVPVQEDEWDCGPGQREQEGGASCVCVHRMKQQCSCQWRWDVTSCSACGHRMVLIRGAASGSCSCCWS